MLAVLLVVYVFNFIDRIIIGILAPLIKADLHLTDTQLGLLGGTAFALLYTALGIPIGWLADRTGRVWIITLALSLWSLLTAACGAAQGFTQLFLARLGVGIGEAGGVAPAYSLLADYFPPQQRARALGAYAFGIPIGSAAGLVVGGLLASRLDWRMTFVVVGMAGLLLVPLLRLTVREPVRGGFESGTPAAAPPLREVVRRLAGKRAFWGLSIAAASSSIAGYGILFWMPSFLLLSYHFTLAQVSVYLGAIILVGGTAGVWLGAALTDHFGTRRRSAFALVPALALLLAVPCYAFGVLVRPPGWGLAVFALPVALGLAWLGPVTAAIQHLVPPGMRTLASSVFLFINNLIGLGLGSLLIGALSDHFRARYGPDALGYAILAALAFYALSSALFALSSRWVDRDWEG